MKGGGEMCRRCLRLELLRQLAKCASVKGSVDLIRSWRGSPREYPSLALPSKLEASIYK